MAEAGDPGGGVPEFAQEAPVLEGRHGLLDESADLRVGPVHRLLTGGKGLPSPPAGDADGSAGASVALDAPIDVKQLR